MFAHVDSDAFFASALTRRQPKLRGKPILALGMGGGCVIAASYEAKACGVKTGMRLTDARKLCPHAIAIPSDFDEALVASREIEDILKNNCPFLERYSVDEWFLDLNAVPKVQIPTPLTWAEHVQNTVKQNVALTVSIGIGPTKLLSKMASEYRKPAGITIVQGQPRSPKDSGTGAASCAQYVALDTFLRDRPDQAIPGIGNRRGLHADAHGWKTAWDVAHADKETVRKLFGKPGREMQEELLGNSIWALEHDTRPPKSISRCRSFRATSERSIIVSYLFDHLTYTMLKMRRHHLSCTAIAVWLRNGEYQHRGRDAKLPQPMDTEDQLFPYIIDCFDRLYSKQPHCTQVGLGLLGLRPKGGTQYSLFEDPNHTDRCERVQQTLDTVHEKHGRDLLTRGSAMPTNTGKRKKGLHVVNDMV